MKFGSTGTKNIVHTISIVLAFAVAPGLRYLLAIPSEPFDIQSGWRAIAGWTVVVFALGSLIHTVIHFFRPIPRRQEPDLYTLAQAERSVNPSPHEEQQERPRNP